MSPLARSSPHPSRHQAAACQTVCFSPLDIDLADAIDRMWELPGYLSQWPAAC